MIKNLHLKGISPIIGVILLVSVTVALVTLSTIIVFDIGSDISESSDATVQVSETNEGIEISVIRNENVDEFIIQGPESEETISNIEYSKTINQGDGNYTIIAITKNGAEEVLHSKTVVDSEKTVSGTVSTNPYIEGAIVKAVKNEDVIESTTTDENGDYSLTLDNTEGVDIVADTQGTIVERNGEEREFYAKASRSVGQKTIINFEFPWENVKIDNGDATATSVSDGELSDKYTLEDAIEISNLEGLQSINKDLDEDYIIINNINGSSAGELNDGEGFEPIGDEDNKFNGTLDGQGYTVNNLEIEDEYASVFQYVGSDGEIDNIGLIDNEINDGEDVGGLVKQNNGIINKSYTTGNIEDAKSAGGLVNNNTGVINNSYTIGDVEIESASLSAAGISSVNTGIINNSYALGDVKGNLFSGEGTGSGGIVGINDNGGEIKESYATGEVDAINSGGITGWNNGGEVKTSYWDENNTIDGVSKDDGLIEDIIGLDTEEMQGTSAETNMTNLDFVNTWINVEEDYPALQWQE